MTRDVGTQSTPTNVGSNSPSPASTPPIVERALKRCELEEDSPNSNFKVTPETEVCPSLPIFHKLNLLLC